ncbi:hypothetical protein LINPERHAP2_LOCUS14779, partial [Linum perenne]
LQHSPGCKACSNLVPQFSSCNLLLQSPPAIVSPLSCARLTMDSQNSQSIPFLPPLHDGRETRTKCRTKGGLRSRLTGATSRSTPIPPTRKPMKKRSVYWKYYALDTDEM